MQTPLKENFNYVFLDWFLDENKGVIFIYNMIQKTWNKKKPSEFRIQMILIFSSFNYYTINILAIATAWAVVKGSS